VYAELHRWNDCFEFMDFMVAHQIKPDLGLFNILLKHFAKHAPVAQLEKLKDRMVKEGLLVSKHVYYLMQESYARHDMRDKVVEMFEKARREIIQPYIAMIREYGKWKQPQKATEVFETMKDDLHTTGFTPGPNTYNALISTYCDNNCFQEAQAIVDVIRKDKTKYNSDTFFILLDAGLRVNNIPFVLQTYARVKKLKLKVSPTHQRQVEDWAKRNKIDLSVELLRITNNMWKD